MAAAAATGGRTLFISDLHLDESRPAAVATFERFLDELTPGADALYILGDLFEYWVGDDGLVMPLPARVSKALQGASRQLPTYFMHGNRDFLVAKRFAHETGVVLVEDPTVVDLYGTRTLLMHGDTLCTGDLGYQKFRVQVRDPRWQAAALARSLDERVETAQRMRADSEGAKQDKSMDIMDVAPDAVEAAFAQSGCDVMIHGHTHRPGRHVHRVGSRECVRWVLNDWYTTGGYLEVTAAGTSSVQLAL